MPGIDLRHLLKNTSIIDSGKVKVDYHTDRNGSPVISATLLSPPGTAFFMSDDLVIEKFYKNKITLQEFFDQSTGDQVTIRKNRRLTHCSKQEIAIRLEEGDRFLNQFISSKD